MNRSPSIQIFVFAVIFVLFALSWQTVIGVKNASESFSQRIENLTFNNKMAVKEIFREKIKKIKVISAIFDLVKTKSYLSFICKTDDRIDCGEGVAIWDGSTIEYIDHDPIKCGQERALADSSGNIDRTGKVGDSFWNEKHGVLAAFLYPLSDGHGWIASCFHVGSIRELWREIGLPSATSMAIVRSSDFRLWIREPFSPELIGRDLSDGPLVAAIRAYGVDSEATADITATKTDFVKRTVHWQPIGIDDLLLVVGYPRSLSHGIWQEQQAVHLAFGVGLGLILFVTLFMSGRTILRQHAHTSDIAQRLDLATSGGEVGIWDYNFDKDTLTWNDQMFHIYGRDPNLFGGQFADWRKSVHPDDLDGVENSLAEARRTGTRFRSRFRVIREDGREVWIGAVAEFNDFKGGIPNRVLGVNLDITGAVRDQERASKMLQEALDQNIVKNRVLASLSHELRTPLNAIMGFSQVLMSDENDQISRETRDSYIEDIFNSGAHLTSLIENMLNMASIETGEFTLVLRSIDIGASIRNAARLLIEISLDDLPELTVAVESDLPPVVADERAVKQVLINLLSNALKFTPANGAISMDAALAGKHVRVVVSDTGQGIPQDAINRLGQAFERVVRTDNSSKEGMGLGLAISRNLIERMGGTLEIESRLGKGTCVSFTVPIAPGRIHESTPSIQ